MSTHSAKFECPDALLERMISQGRDSYFGEPVSVLEHSLQAAHFASQSGSPDTLIAAALLHDVGHLLHQQGEEIADHGIDTRHEELANQILAAHLPESVTEPIRLHVAAKRYLCFADKAYLSALSQSSVVSLGLQGSPMSSSEAEAFLALPFSREAITLRLWDDDAKIHDLAVPKIHSYLPLLKTLWR